MATQLDLRVGQEVGTGDIPKFSETQKLQNMWKQCHIFYQFPGSKNHWEENIFSNFWFQVIPLKRGDFCQFLASKNL